VTSRASSTVSRGKIEGIERAMRVLPAPGRPAIIMLCDPAADTSLIRNPENPGLSKTGVLVSVPVAQQYQLVPCQG
jgi:hypothetical protein